MARCHVRIRLLTFCLLSLQAEKWLKSQQSPLPCFLISLLTRWKQFIHQLNNQQFDIVLIPPFWYPVAVDQKGYVPLLNMAEPFRVQLLVLDDSEIQSAEDLRGRIIATPPAFAPVSQMAIRFLPDQGLVPAKDVKLMENRTADSCLDKVVRGLASACVVPPYAQDYFEQTRQVKFRRVSESESIPGVALVVSQRLDDDARDQVKQFFLELGKTEAGRQLMTHMKTSGFILIEKGEYEPVRKLLQQMRPLH